MSTPRVVHHPTPPVPEQYWNWDRYGVGWLAALLYKAQCAAQQANQISRPPGSCLPDVGSEHPTEMPGGKKNCQMRHWQQGVTPRQPRPVYRCMQCRQDFDREDRVRGHQRVTAPQARLQSRRGRTPTSTPGPRHAASAIDLRNAHLNMDVDV